MKNKKRADGRVQSKVYLGDGKYKYVYAANNTELQKKLNDLRYKLGKGIDLTAEHDTLSEWSARWLKIKKHDVSYSRYNYLCSCLKKYEHLDNVPISKIKAIDIQDVILELADDDFAYETLRKIKGAISGVLQLAVDNRVMDYNPALAVKVPRRAPKTVRRALTDEERQWIIDTPHKVQRMAMIMMYAGLRRGELVPLLWSDIDLVNKTITVNKSVEYIKNQPIVKDTTKTPAGMRTVIIPDILVNYLLNEDRESSLLVCPDGKGQMLHEGNHKGLWESYLHELNYRYGDFTGLLVPGKDGKPQQFERPKTRYGYTTLPLRIPRITMHWLRHTYITQLYLSGVDVLTAKEQAGHSNIKITLDIYTHLDSIYKTRQIDKLNDYLAEDARKNIKIG